MPTTSTRSIKVGHDNPASAAIGIAHLITAEAELLAKAGFSLDPASISVVPDVNRGPGWLQITMSAD